MKIRLAFVSNSSSASFVVSSSLYKTVSDLAIEMLKQRDFNDDQELIDKIENMPNPDQPVSFNSINYRTFIAKMDGKLLVDTCNNHNWDIDYSMDVTETSHITCKMRKILSFWYVDFDLYGKEADVSPYYCKQHSGVELMQLDETGEIVCPLCYLERDKKNEIDEETKRMIKTLREKGFRVEKII